MPDYEHHLGYDARQKAEAEAMQVETAERELDALTPTVLAAERKQRLIQAVTNMQMAATRVLREVENAEALGELAGVAPLRVRHDEIQEKAKAKLAEINKVVAPIA